MNLRDALVQQSPSLALQRAATDEIAMLDAIVAKHDMDASRAWYKINKLQERIWELEDYLEAHDLTKEFEEWLKRNTEE